MASSIKDHLVVRVVGPGDRQSYDQSFPPGYSKDKMLADLSKIKRRFGRTATVVKPDTTKDSRGSASGIEVPHPDHSSPFVWDDPRTRVVLGRYEVRNDAIVGFTELSVLREAVPPPAETPTLRE